MVFLYFLSQKKNHDCMYKILEKIVISLSIVYTLCILQRQYEFRTNYFVVLQRMRTKYLTEFSFYIEKTQQKHFFF